ncbi:MAG TPA: response regulator transcription factor [Rubrivivax sp.]|nr:response regulator transcription factor [Burkholderiales bacterium]HNT38144.1 response regulator transcription factor [Rubrivivax sp.]
MSVKVLILEDNPVARGFLCRVVRESFSDLQSIVEAGDLEGARRHLGRVGGATATPGADAFRLILVDLELPDGNGLDLLSELANHPATKIVTTLYADDDHLFPALQRGADGYLLKEDRFEVLVQELQRIVRGQPPLSPAIARRLLGHFRASVNADADAAGASASSEAPGSEPLTPRESEVLTYASKGFTIKEIASLMAIKAFAVNDHIKAIYRKLKLSSRAEAARPAGEPDRK